MQCGVESVDNAETNAPLPRVIGRPFVQGNTANPQGRPKGSRNKLGEAFVEALHRDFLEHGPVVIERVREEKPDQYLKVIAMIVPKELHVRERSGTEDLTDEELADLITAVRASRAKVVEGSEATPRSQQSDSVHGGDVCAVSDGSMPSDNRGASGEG